MFRWTQRNIIYIRLDKLRKRSGLASTLLLLTPLLSSAIVSPTHTAISPPVPYSYRYIATSTLLILVSTHQYSYSYRYHRRQYPTHTGIDTTKTTTTINHTTTFTPFHNSIPNTHILLVISPVTVLEAWAWFPDTIFDIWSSSNKRISSSLTRAGFCKL